jgi:hypothetical protein
VGVEQIVAAVVGKAEIDRGRTNLMRQQSALFGGEAGSAVESWFWALAVKLGLPLVERLRKAADSNLWPPVTSSAGSGRRRLSEEAQEARKKIARAVSRR